MKEFLLLYKQISGEINSKKTNVHSSISEIGALRKIDIELIAIDIAVSNRLLRVRFDDRVRFEYIKRATF